MKLAIILLTLIVVLEMFIVQLCIKRLAKMEELIVDLHNEVIDAYKECGEAVINIAKEVSKDEES